jgi:chemotaxis protein MotB
LSDSHSHGDGKPDPLAALGGRHGGHEEEGGEGNWLVSYADMMTLLVGFFVILMSFSTVDQEKFEKLKKETSKKFGGKYESPYSNVTERIRESLRKSGLGNQYSIKETEAGVEISFTGSVFFDTGSATLKPQGQLLLDKIIPIIRTETTDFNIIVEGHTDDIPISSNFQYRSNWELSSIRACRVLDAFEIGGFAKSRLMAVGYADARPLVPNRNEAGAAIPDNQAQNRRVVIKVLKRPTPSVGGEEGARAPETDHGKS